MPTVRACIAALLVLAGIALGREAITLRLVAVGALVVLLLWPESLPGASFQMSFAAIVAIVALHENPRVQAWLSRRDEGWPTKLGRGLLALVLTGLAVEIALMPIALFHFHKAGLYGALANVIAIPLTTFIIMPLEALALLFDLVGLGAPFWWLTGQALSLLLWLAHAAADAPGAVALLPAMPPAAFALIVAGGLWICLWRTKWRRYGLIPVALGALWAMLTPAPDLLVTGDGRHLVLRTEDGRLALLRPRAGDYVRDTLAELSGAEPDYLELERLPNRRLQRGPVRRSHRPRRPTLAYPRHPYAAFRPLGPDGRRLRRSGHRRRRSRAATRLQSALAPRRPLLPAPHGRARGYARRAARGRHRRRARGQPSLGRSDALSPACRRRRARLRASHG